MQIDWSKAPGWARWVAMDKSGEIWFFENKPDIYGSQWMMKDEGRWAKCGNAINWQESLQERPQ